MAFRSVHTPLQLIDQVREVSRAASKRHPEQVTQAQWNAARARAGYPDVMKAHAICQRLGLKWSQVLRVAHRSRADALRDLNQAASSKGRKGWRLQDVAYALRQVSVKLGGVAPNRSEYTSGRERILAASRATRHRQAAERSIPSLPEIETVLKQNRMSWEDGLVLAGFPPAPRPSAPPALKELDTARLFAQQTGFLPANVSQLMRWARSEGIAISPLRASRLKRALTELRRERKAAALPALKHAARGDPPPSTALAARDGLPLARAPRWTRETIIPGLARAVALLGPARQLSQRSLKRIASDHPEQRIPSWTSVHRALRAHPGETWDDWRREAEQQAGPGPPGTH